MDYKTKKEPLVNMLVVFNEIILSCLFTTQTNKPKANYVCDLL